MPDFYRCHELMFDDTIKSASMMYMCTKLGDTIRFQLNYIEIFFYKCNISSKSHILLKVTLYVCYQD